MPTLRPSAELREQILKRGCYSPEENRRIYEKWFAPGPRQKFQKVNRKYRLEDKVNCDIGCGYGMNLPYCQPDSYGIDIADYESDFARSIGLTIHQRDFLHDPIDDLPRVEAVWCSAVLEHVESIHIFLRKIALLLEDNGLALIYVPSIPLAPFLGVLPILRRYMTGYLYSDHINAFTPSTLRFFCERAGFDTLEVSPFLPGAAGLINHVPLLNRIVDGCVYVGRKIPDWDYPERATRRATETGTGFVYRWDVDGTKSE